MASNTIIQEINGLPVLSNGVCRWEPMQKEGVWGLGTFYVADVPISDPLPYFIREEASECAYYADSYRILENTSEQGKIRFSGKSGKLSFDLDVTLRHDRNAYLFEYELDAVHPIYHPLYAQMPFDTATASFVKFPYDDTLTRENFRRFTVMTDRGRVPFFFGSGRPGGKPVFAGLGYRLTDAFYNGRFEFDPESEPQAPLKIFSLFAGLCRPNNLQCNAEFEHHRGDLRWEYANMRQRFSYVLATAQTQFDCVRAYIAFSGYDREAVMSNSIDDACDLLMQVYKNTRGYVPGKGYHQLIRMDTGDFDTTISHGWYSKYIVTGPQVQLAVELYRHWASHRQEEWARERAFEMADFLLLMQKENGFFPNWDTDTDGIGMMHPDDVQGTKFNDFKYGVSDMMIGAYHLLELYDAVLETEGTERTDWKAAAHKCIRFVAGLAGEDGVLGRNYDDAGNYDKIGTTIAPALFAFARLYRDSGDKTIKQIQLRVEKWIYENYISINKWGNGCMDGGAWQGAGWPPPDNNDSLGIINFAGYCAMMHQRSGEQRYLDMAKDVFAYFFLLAVPAEIPGFTHRVRGLMREQDFYSCFDLPIKIDDFMDCLPYLSKVTGDPIFMEYFRIALQTEMDFQEKTAPYPGIHIGLESTLDGKAPTDVVAEGPSCYIVRFASLFLKTVRDPRSYQYVGGPGWGLGRDYNLAFNPDMGEGRPYILCSSAMIRDAAWSSDGTELRIFAYDRTKPYADLEIRWYEDYADIKKVYILAGQGKKPAVQYYDPASKVIALRCHGEAPSKFVRLAVEID